MTFRFDEMDWNTKRSDKETTQDNDVKSENHPEIKDKTQQTEYPKLTVVPEPMDGWGDPFSRNDHWSELKMNTHRRDTVRDDEHDDLPLEDADYTEYRKNRPTSLWKIFGTVTAAVVTGALFGFVVLSFIDPTGVISKDVLPTKDKEVVAVTNMAPVSTDVSVAMIPVTIEPQTYYMLQYGVFSDIKRVEIAKKELEQFGLAAGDDPDQENRVYAGISTDREQAKLLSNQLKTQGVELYVREIPLLAVREVAFAGSVDMVEDYYDVSAKLISSLSNQSASLLGMERPIPLSNSETVALTELHRLWTESMKTFKTGLNTEALAKVKQMELSMNSALSSVAEYNKNTSKGHLWEIQSFMMQYMMGQKQVLQLMIKS
ncbi:SPOR domain-containing protein [Paenibacillus sp. CMAA1364]